MPFSIGVNFLNLASFLTRELSPCVLITSAFCNLILLILKLFLFIRLLISEIIFVILTGLLLQIFKTKCP